MEPKAPAKNNRVIIILLALIIVLLAAVLAVFLLKDNDAAQSADPAQGLAYATQGVTVVDDEDALQKAVDEAFAKAEEGNIALEYKNEGVSSDGKTFDCYIANAVENTYDMYINIYADSSLSDQLFLSGLIRPGEAFESIKLERTLEPGTHTVYCAFTQVEADLATIHGQVVVTLQFSVS